jgi:parallel beta-helix repeat protein
MLPTRLLILSLLGALPLAAQQPHPIPDGPLSGTYTVGGAGDFRTIGAAVERLRAHGVAGPVTLEVRAERYYEAIEIGAIPGVDSLHAITIRGVPGIDHALPVIEGLRSAEKSPPLLLLRNAHWVTIAGLHLKPMQHAEAALFIDSSRDVVVAECLIGEAQETGADSVSGAGIIVRASGNVRIERNSIAEAETGVQVTGVSVTGGSASGCTIVGNRITSVASRGIFLDHASGCRIEANRIFIETTQVPATGIEVERCAGPTAIERNILVVKASEGFGISISKADPPLDTLAVRVVNNMVSLLLEEHAGLHMSAGISLDESPHAEILHNSVLVRSTGKPVVQPAGLYLWGTSAAAITILNNIFAVTGGPALHWAGRPGAWRRDQLRIVCDYNDLFADGGPGVINTSRELQPVRKLTMEEWRRLAGTDRHSFAASPDFIGPENLYGSRSTWSDGRLMKGTPLATVPVDIDNAPRDHVHPAVGAAEPPH